MQPSPTTPRSHWFVVVPIKGGPAAKSRFLDERRSTLATAMAQDTCAAAAEGVGDPDRIIVVTADRAAAQWAEHAGHRVVDDPGTGLNCAVSVGAATAWRAGAGAVAALLADHPALTGAEFGSVLDGAGSLGLGFVPDAAGTGTALVTSTTSGVLRCAFGPGSARKHAELALVQVNAHCPGLRLDVDTPRDLAAALELGVGPRTRAVVLRYALDRAGHDPHHL